MWPISIQTVQIKRWTLSSCYLQEFTQDILRVLLPRPPQVSVQNQMWALFLPNLSNILGFYLFIYNIFSYLLSNLFRLSEFFRAGIVLVLDWAYQNHIKLNYHCAVQNEVPLAIRFRTFPGPCYGKSQTPAVKRIWDFKTPPQSPHSQGRTPSPR